MSRPPTQSDAFRGRYAEPVPTSNLGAMEDDFPEFEPFDDEVQPRGFVPTGQALMVQQVDMCQQINKPNHYTTAYDTGNLVVRRGQEFVIRVTFSRPLADGDDFQLEFLIGSNPSASKGSLVVVTFNSRHGSSWIGQILEMQGQSVTLGITPTPDAIVGKFRTYVAIAAGSGMQRTKRDTSTDLYLLFNAWCPTDAVFLSDGAERSEYVLNDIGIINQGSVGAVSSRNWMYGQFERGVLDACIHILDASRMPIFNRGNVIKLIRKGSAMINSQDDNGVLVGNWSDDYSMGRPPTSWTGSVQILLQYANTGVPVCFAQCWVFAGVFNTFLRCLGIPSRVITNFNSAHDNTGNLKTDLIFKADGTPDRRNTRDSIWNYHCWNEVFTVRPDLPNGLGGWQVVDATPQETSDGHFRCGPAPVAAIKEGLLCHPFDCGFVFAEVNSDVVYQKRDRYGTLTPYRVDKTYVGQCIYTKAVGSSGTHDITHTYKYPEGSADNERTMNRAEEYGCVRDHSEVADTQLSVTISCEQVGLGHDVNLVVDFHNQGDVPRTVQANLSGSIVFYTGVIANHFKDQPFSATVPANQKESVMLMVTAQEYMPHLGAQLCLHFVVTGQADDQSLIASKVVDLQTPGLQMQVSGSPQVQQEMAVTVTFTNPFSFPLQDVYVAMEGPGLMNQRSHFYRVIEPQASISWSETFLPRLPGPRRLVAVLNCRNLHQVSGLCDVHIAE
ncbi:coagulation factor XIII A chain-like [Acanthopagrus latus]|uniref:coagulation factor XIII A chain-like n=1 Tax=Acanthopagrus latus TaxID=8177 RepID=UPI00187C4770|nr:coagulation factor XIII A chain-like [Acanthopagrus latus]XP_036935018.1 coagulation factor XIII A chain-like [Acanthopagrus latus]